MGGRHSGKPDNRGVIRLSPFGEERRGGRRLLRPTGHAGKMESTKQVSLFNKNSKSLTYKETMNQSDLPVSERADKYGTYDVFVDDQDTQYVFLADSDLFAAF